MTDREGHGRTALVTGASAGIGAAFALELAAHGFALVLVARRADRLDALSRDVSLRFSTSATVITADLARPEAPEALFGELNRRGLAIDVLVNNAGFGVPGDLRCQPWQRHADFLQVMVTAVVHLTYLAERDMAARGYGRIINVASLAGLLPATAGHTLYAAAKSFVIRFTEALAREHADDDIHATAVCPGFTRSEFHDVMGNREQVSKLPNILWMDATAVARLGYAAAMRGDPIAVTGLVNRAIAAGLGALPRACTQLLLRSPARKYRVRGALGTES